MAENNQNEIQEFQEEYKHFGSDVKKVIISNLLILGLIIAAYFVNKSTGIVNRLLDIV